MSDAIPLAVHEQKERASDKSATAAPVAEPRQVRHSALVRVTHWLTALAFACLLLTGIEILISHPRFYWGETGNVNMTPLFSFRIPSSRAIIHNGYDYVLPDQNGWSRALHFEAAWLLLFAGLLYLGFGFFRGHFRRHLFPAPRELAPRRLLHSLAEHLRFRRPGEEEAWSYNLIQRLTYLLVIFVLFPLVIWTGLCMSPTFEGAFPTAVILLGGRQSARTLHFFVSTALTLFLLVHVLMVFLAGFRKRVGAMITGRMEETKEQR